MSTSYRAIQWNAFKRKYDGVLVSGMILYLAVFTGLNAILFPYHNATTIVIRAFGTLALLMLHVVLIIGPLCRLHSAFLPLLYNRRHLGVATFVAAAVHGGLSLVWFHGAGNLNPLVSLFVSNLHYGSFRFFPFQVLGFGALIILALMAFTSHDFWLAFFTPRVWKAMHMMVYAAYALVVLHVALGVIQFEDSPVLYVLLLAGVLLVGSLHLAAATREWRRDRAAPGGEWVPAGKASSIPDNRARVVTVGGERVAVFRYGDRLSAVHNVCKHQQGPLGEGLIVDGCITCPWHGYQYQPGDGCAPPPFTEKVHTYRVRLDGDEVFVHATPLPEGTAVKPARMGEPADAGTARPLFIGWQTRHRGAMLRPALVFVAATLFLAVTAALVVTTHQHRIAVSTFDYRNPVTLTGHLVATPFPALAQLAGKDIFGNPAFRLFPLVNEGKFGAGDKVRSFLAMNPAGQVRLTGNRIARGNRELLEVTAVEPAGDGIAFTPHERTLAMDTVIRGEIIDPKCYFGAMNPGEGKPHRSCAIRCISGGIMPMLKYEEEGQLRYAVLVRSDGTAPNADVLEAVAEPVRIRGSLKQTDDWLVFHFDGKHAINRIYR